MAKHTEMGTQHTADAVRYLDMSTDELRATFMIESLFASGEIRLALTDLDRAVVGAAIPAATRLELPCPEGLRAAFFCQRRELGILNIGGAGSVMVDGQEFKLDNCDGLYVGRGSRVVTFASSAPSQPAQFYLLSYPAHAEYPTTPIRQADARTVQLGTDEDANRRTIYQYIHEEGAKSCQLVMGFTELAPGSVWNTMPPHTHARRTEIYTYFKIPEGHRVFHFMGRPDATRHICVPDRGTVLSPDWSIHCGVGTRNYAFIWGMGGENQAFADMDSLTIDALR